MTDAQLVTIIANNYEDRNFTTRDVAEYFNITPSAVENLRALGIGPRCRRDENGRWIYACEDIKEFVPPLGWRNETRARSVRSRSCHFGPHADVVDWIAKRSCFLNADGRDEEAACA